MTAGSMAELMSAMQEAYRDPEGMKMVLEFLSKMVMQQEVKQHLGAAHHERTQKRQGYRNGTRSRTLRTRIGELKLEVPQVRGCRPYEPSLFDRWERSERALLTTCSEIYLQGVSTRKVELVLQAMCPGLSISAMTVSRINMELDEKLKFFRIRKLDHTSWPYLKVDARYEKVRVEGHIVSQAVLIVTGIDAQGRRHVLDWRVGDSESEATWGEIFRDLKDRGVSGVKLITSDAHAGIRRAIDRHFQGIAWQRCQVHFKRELCNKLSFKQRKSLMSDLKIVFAPQEKIECLKRGEELASVWEGKCPALSKMLREGLEDCLSMLGFPPQHRIRLNSTNMMENLMRILRKRTRVVGIFPNRESCDRLIGALLLEMHEKWQTEGSYCNFDMTLLH